MGYDINTLNQLPLGIAIGSPLFTIKGLKSVHRQWISQMTYQEESEGRGVQFSVFIIVSAVAREETHLN